MNCKTLLDKYIQYLKNYLSFEEIEGKCQLEIPFPRPSRDSIILKIEKLPDGTYKITDDGFMDEYLFLYGLNLWDLKKKSLKKEFERLKKAYKIILEDSPEIIIIANEDNLLSQIYEMSELLNEICIFSKIKQLEG